MIRFNFTWILMLIGISLFAQDKQQPKELGEVHWLRNYDEALSVSQEKDLPILLLFQEVPGCATCQNYGQSVLSHPLIVDAIESEFVPLAIYNNKAGHDKKILEQFREPSWNNPVVRSIHTNGKTSSNRLNGNYSELGLVNYMIDLIKQEKKAIPKYLSLVQDELEAKAIRSETAYYKMYCFWSGESQLGTQEGVFETVPGFMNGAEVVKVKFDPNKTKEKNLDKFAKSVSCTRMTDVSKFKADKDPQYYLKKSAYRYLPLTPMQKTKINSVISTGGDASYLLSPMQKEWLDKIMSREKQYKMIYELDFKRAWEMMESQT